MSAPAPAHVLLTRFNLPSAGAERFVRAQDGWLRTRIGLFERYCLPSVRRQSDPDVRWLVYFDPESPDWLHEWVARTSATGVFTPRFRTSVPREDLLGDIDALLPGPTSLLLTTNLDNDDALPASFVARMRAAAQEAPAGRRALYVGSGLVRTDAELFLVRDTDNAFCSVLEPRDAAVTCWADWHNRLHLQMPVTVLEGAPGWLQVVHGTNVTNRIRGERVEPGPYAADFGAALDGVRPPSRSERWRDRLVDHPRRRATWLARSAAKRVVLDTVGTQGLDRAKDRLASARSRVRAISR